MAYLNGTEIESALLALATRYPLLCERIALPNRTLDWTGTTPGRLCHALRIGTRRDGSRPGVLFTGCVHGREWGGADICVYFAADLLEAYASGSGLSYGGTSFTDRDVASILERLEVFVFPNVNPDGRDYDRVTPTASWRKNRNPTGSGGRPWCAGVDINRNHDFLWDFPRAFDPDVVAGPYLASTDPCSDLYHGSGPASEPETRNVVWLLDGQPQIRWYMDIHSYGTDVLYSWGDDENQADEPSMTFRNPSYDGRRGRDGDEYREYIAHRDWMVLRDTSAAVCQAINAVYGQPTNRYAAKQSFYLTVAGGENVTFPTSGASDDYAYSRHLVNPAQGKVYAFTLEFGAREELAVQTFHPEWEYMRQVIPQINAGMVELCRRALLPVRWPDRWRWKWLFPWEIWGPFFVAVIGAIAVLPPLRRRVVRGLRRLLR